jgi:predicted thioesterase
MMVEYICTLTSVQGRELSFEIHVKDGKDLIGVAVHKRFIIKTDSFFEKAQSKLKS